MERLTKWLNDKKALCYEACEKECVNGYSECHKCKPFADSMKRLLIFPCAVGDTVWIIYDKEVYEAKATAVLGYQGKSLIRIYTIFDMYDVFYQDGRTMEHQTFGDFGKTVFLTREEAEVALEKMKGEEHE